MDGRAMIRTRLRLRKANWDAASTGDGFLCSVHPTAKWETAGGMDSTLFNPRPFSANFPSEERLAFCLNILVIKVTLGNYESYLDFEIHLLNMIKSGLNHRKIYEELLSLRRLSKFSLVPHSYKPSVTKPLCLLFVKMQSNVAHTQWILLLSTGAAEKLKYYHADSMLPISLCIPLFVKVNYFIGVEKKSGL